MRYARRMRRRLRAPFIVTLSAASLFLSTGCKKTNSGGGECLPPDCHMNPPQPPPDPTTTPSVTPQTEAADAGPTHPVNPPPPPPPPPG